MNTNGYLLQGLDDKFITQGNASGCDGLFSCSNQICQIWSQPTILWVAVRLPGAGNCTTMYSSAYDYKMTSSYTTGELSRWSIFLTVILLSAALLVCVVRIQEAFINIFLSVAVVLLVCAYSLWLAYLIQVHSEMADYPPTFITVYVLLANISIIIWEVLQLSSMLYSSYRASRTDYRMIN